MSDEPHAVVKLLLARMESHPEEFRVGGTRTPHGRWVHHVDMVHDNGSDADRAVLNAKLRSILMDELHEQVMEELCNGEERRRKEREEQEYERNLSKSLALTKQQMMQQSYQGLQSAFNSQYQNSTIGIGTTAPSTKLDVQGLAGQSPTDNALTGTGTLNQIKRMLGAKK